MFKKIIALRNSKIIALSQMMDIYLGNLLQKLKQNLLFEPSSKLDLERKDINLNITQFAFFRWKMMHATGAGCKPSNKQLEAELEHLKLIGSELLAGSKWNN